MQINIFKRNVTIHGVTLALLEVIYSLQGISLFSAVLMSLNSLFACLYDITQEFFIFQTSDKIEDGWINELIDRSPNG